jgi:uncharacterized repeat protein (TIGR02543 family)/uncharacterized delta-60 repeat protein
VYSQPFQNLRPRVFALVLALSISLQPIIAKPARADSGGIDTSFGNAGSATVAIGDPGSMISGLAIDANDKIYQSGANYVNSVWVGAVARLNPDGTIDGQFGNSGFYQDASQTGWFTDVLFHNDLIYVLDRLGRVIRLLPNGQRDTTFASSGVLAFTPSEITRNLSYGTLSVNSVGHIFISGWGSRTVSGNSSYDSFVAAFDEQGSSLSNFGTSGTLYLPRTTGQDLIYDSVIDENGNLFLSGSKDFGGGFWIVKVLTTGVLDSSFGTSGEVVTSAPSGYTGYSWDDISLDSNNEILVTGGVSNVAGTDSDIFVARFNADGSQDFQRRISYGRYEEGQFVQKGRGGIYIAARSSSLISGTYVDKQHLIRLTDLGAVDTTFGVDGVINSKLGEVHSAAMDSNGDLFLSGNVWPSDNKVIVKYAAVAAPSMPLSLSATASAESVALDWTQPLDDGSRPVTDYLIQTSSNGSNWTTINDGISSTSQIEVGNLVPNTVYYFRVSASNSFFTGPNSDSISVRTLLPSRPGAPTLVATNSDLSVQLSWQAPSTGGGFLSGYLLQKKIGSGSWSDLASPNDATTSYSDLLTRADAGLIYYRVKAINDGGSSDYSDSVSVRVFPIPLSPSTITAVGGSSNITISWNSPSNSLNAGDLTYLLQITNNGLTWIDFTPSSFPTSTSAVFDSAIGGASYRFRVKAVNSVGESSWSTSSNLSQLASSYTLTYIYDNATSGNIVSSATYTEGESGVSLPSPTRSGYTFVGWFNNPTFTGRAIVSPYAPSNTHSLYAKWTRNPVKATSSVKPTIAGTAKVGKTLTAKRGTWTGYPAPTISYQWYACSGSISTPKSAVSTSCKKISGATKSSFKIVSAQKGKYVAVLVTGSSAGTTKTLWLSKSTIKIS